MCWPTIPRLFCVSRRSGSISQPNNAIWAADDRLRGLSQANQLWHTDSSFKRLLARMLMLYAHTVVPLGSHTEYADMRAAYDELSPAPSGLAHR